MIPKGWRIRHSPPKRESKGIHKESLMGTLLKMWKKVGFTTLVVCDARSFSESVGNSVLKEEGEKWMDF